MVTAQERLNQILPSWYDLLTQWSQDGSLVAAATDALMLDSSNAKPDAKGQLQSLTSQWSTGNFKSLPEIVLLSNADISGAQGAYAASTGKIYLNADWLLTADQAWIQRVLTEELGHSLDAQLNLMDTTGDEGNYFKNATINNSSYGLSTRHGGIDDATYIVEGFSTYKAEASSGALPKTPTIPFTSYHPSPGGENSVFEFISQELPVETGEAIINSTDDIIMPTYTSKIDSQGLRRYEYLLFRNGSTRPALVLGPGANYDRTDSFGNISFDSTGRYVFSSATSQQITTSPSGVTSYTDIISLDGANQRYNFLDAYGTLDHDIAENGLISMITSGTNGYHRYVSGILQPVTFGLINPSEGTERILQVPTFGSYSNSTNTSYRADMRDTAISRDGRTIYVTGPFYTTMPSGANTITSFISAISAETGDLIWTYSTPLNISIPADVSKPSNMGWKVESTHDNGVVMSTLAFDKSVRAVKFDNNGAIKWDNYRYANRSSQEYDFNLYPENGQYVELLESPKGSVFGVGFDLIDVYDNNGALIWQHKINQRYYWDETAGFWNSYAGICNINDAALQDNGGIVISGDGNTGEIIGALPGQAISSVDGFVRKLDETGKAEWTYLIRGAGRDSVSTTASHNNTPVITVFGTTDTSQDVSVYYRTDSNEEVLIGSVATDGGKSFFLQIDTSKQQLVTKDLYVPVTDADYANIAISRDAIGNIVVDELSYQGTGKNKTLSASQVAWYENPFGLKTTGGVTNNSISANGLPGSTTKTSVDRQIVIDGSLGADSITGSSSLSSKNWLIGGGLFAPGTEPTKPSAAVDRLTGNAGALDVFDLRTSDFTQDAYSRPNSGTAQIQGYTPGEDYIVLAGTGYTINQTTTKIGKGASATTQYGFDILSGSKIIARVGSTSFNALSTPNDLTVITGDVSQMNQLGPTQLGLPTFDSTGTFISAPIRFY